MEDLKRVDKAFKDNAGKDAGRVLGDPANWSGSSGDEMPISAAGGAEQDPDALLATELLKKADEEREKGSELQTN